MIDPNDEAGADQVFQLPQLFLENKLTTSPLDIDQTAFALDYLATLERYVNNQQVRRTLLGNFGMDMLGGDFAGQVFDLDRFWDAFCRVADEQTIARLQYIVDSKKATKTGTPCPDVSFSDPDGKVHQLSEFFGKVLFIDIWATWCGPCCAEIPYIEKHVAHYKDNPNVLFLSISIDSNRQAWLNKLAKDKPQWPQFLCSKEEYELLSRQWGITGIPRFVIVNADGTICQSNAFRPSNEFFREKLDEIIWK